MKWAKLTLIILGFCLSGFESEAQKTICGNLADTLKKGQLTVNAPAGFEQVLSKTRKKNQEEQSFEGYRIQIYSGSDRKKAQEKKSDFYKEFPQKDAYMNYEQPYFKVRIGDFRNKIEAQKLYYTLKKEFSTVLIVPTKIEYPELNGENY